MERSSFSGTAWKLHTITRPERLQQSVMLDEKTKLPIAIQQVEKPQDGFSRIWKQIARCITAITQDTKTAATNKYDCGIGKYSQPSQSITMPPFVLTIYYGFLFEIELADKVFTFVFSLPVINSFFKPFSNCSSRRILVPAYFVLLRTPAHLLLQIALLPPHSYRYPPHLREVLQWCIRITLQSAAIYRHEVLLLLAPICSRLTVLHLRFCYLSLCGDCTS